MKHSRRILYQIYSVLLSRCSMRLFSSLSRDKSSGVKCSRLVPAQRYLERSPAVPSAEQHRCPEASASSGSARQKPGSRRRHLQLHLSTVHPVKYHDMIHQVKALLPRFLGRIISRSARISWTVHDLRVSCVMC